MNDFLSFEDCISSEIGFDVVRSKHFVTEQSLESMGIYTSRVNSDNFVNNNGRKLIELCKGMDLKIVNGCFGSDRALGDFTCVKKNGSSVIDYVVLSSTLMPNILSFEVADFDPCLSDVHRLIGVTFDFSAPPQRAIDFCHEALGDSEHAAEVLKHTSIKWDSNFVNIKIVFWLQTWKV